MCGVLMCAFMSSWDRHASMVTKVPGVVADSNTSYA